jgi:hypothetical protein
MGQKMAVVWERNVPIAGESAEEMEFALGHFWNLTQPGGSWWEVGW